MNTRLFPLLFLLLFAREASAQFRPYSLYHLAPTLTNPAAVATGDYAQVTALYRHAPVSGYQVPSLSYVHPFFGKERGDRYGGMGFTLINQSAGPSGMYRVTGVLGGMGYDQALNAHHRLAAGLQLGFMNQRLDLGGVTTDSQFGGSGYDPALASGESFDAGSRSAVAVNAGLNWYRTDAAGNQTASLGLAVYNLNRPVYPFMREPNREELNAVVTGSFLAARRGNLSVLPTFRYIRLGNAHLANIGSLFSYALGSNGESRLGAGLWYNTNASVSMNLQYEKEKFGVAFGYDASTYLTHEIAPVNRAFELAFTWRVNRRKKAAARKAAPEPIECEPPLPAAEKPQEDAPRPIVSPPKTGTPRESGKTDAGQSPPLPEREEALSRKISYPIGGTDLPAADEQLLDSLAGVLRQHPGWQVQVSGHTCSLGTKAANERVSLERAMNVRARLIAKGVPAAQLAAVGYADAYPIASNRTEAGRARNRRVEFVIGK